MGRRPLNPNGEGAQGSTLQKDKLIEQIAFEMAEGNWRPYRSVREVAVRYGITLGNAQKWAAEATRLLRLSWGQDEAKVAVLERIAQIGRAAEARTEEIVDAKGELHTVRKPDMATAGKMAIGLANILGLSGANSEVVIRLQTMSDTDLALEATRFLARLTEGKGNGNYIEIEGEEVPDAEHGEPDAGDTDEDSAALRRLELAHSKPRG